MFDVLVYLYENYWRPDACPDHAQLTRKLSAVGFESDEIQEALSWLDGLASTAEAYSGQQSADAMRVYTPAEQELLGEESSGFPLSPAGRGQSCEARQVRESQENGAA